MKWITALAFGVALSACGVDGEPIKPTVNSSVTLNNNGVNVGTNIGVRRGPFSLGLNF